MKPIAIALGVFGAVAALAALLIGVQIISRQLRAAEEDLGVLRALGAAPGTTIADGLIGMMGAITVGAVLAGVVAVALSPLSPLGPVRSVYPGSAVAFDWTVLGIGLAAPRGRARCHRVRARLSGGTAPGRPSARRAAPPAPRGSCDAVASTGLPPPAAVGVRFALESGRGRTAVPVRSALLGCCPGGGPRGRHPHLRERAGVTGVASCAVRMELDVHAQSDQHGSVASRDTSRP